jgi:hypothetical protein
MVRAEEAHGAASDQTRQLSGSTQEHAGGLADQAHAAPDRVVEQTGGIPIAAGLIAFARLALLRGPLARAVGGLLVGPIDRSAQLVLGHP